MERLSCPSRLSSLVGLFVLTPSDNTFSQSKVHRAKFLDALEELVPSDRAHFGKCLVKLEDNTLEEGSLLPKFKDGTAVEADMVIGADGIHSHTREYVLEDEPDKERYQPRYSGATAYRNLVPMKKVIHAMGTDIAVFNSLFILDGAMVLSYPFHHSERLNVVAYTWKHEDWSKKEWVIPVDTEEVKSSYHGQDPRITKLLNAIGMGSLDLPDIPRYNRGRVCIISDTAHAPTPFHGQGAGQAIEDALTILELFAEVKKVSDVPLAFAAYDQVRRPRGNKNVTESRTTGKIGSLLDPEHSDMKAIADGFAPRMMWLWTRDMQEQSDDAVKLFEHYKNKS